MDRKRKESCTYCCLNKNIYLQSKSMHWDSDFSRHRKINKEIMIFLYHKLIQVQTQSSPFSSTTCQQLKSKLLLCIQKPLYTIQKCTYIRFSYLKKRLIRKKFGLVLYYKLIQIHFSPTPCQQLKSKLPFYIQFHCEPRHEYVHNTVTHKTQKEKKK
jgi:hypothetical protein